MSREIKFRFWTGKSMICSDSYISLYYFFEIISNVDLQQFTGLKDKKGKEIYEGDIVTYKRSVGNWTGQTMTTIHEVVFNEEVFSFVMKYGNSYIKLRKHWGYEYEVIGNIYENPNLLQ